MARESQNIFISYRLQFDSGIAGRIYDSLSHKLRSASVFMDVDRLHPGDDFAAALERSLAECRVLLVVIGPEWLEATSAVGSRRLLDADDFVRKEIRAGLLQRGIRVIPVLVNGALMPERSRLPEDLQELAGRQGFAVRHERFNADMESLGAATRAVLPGLRATRWPTSRLTLAATAALALLATGILLLRLAQHGREAARVADAPFKTEGCKPGLVWREAYFGDNVCVSRPERDEALAQNANAERNRRPGGGAYGTNTCRDGYVWRVANAEDVVCVTPFERQKAAEQNAAAPRNRL